MLLYVSDLLQNALDLGWPVAKGSYKVLMTEMETTELSWDDLGAVQSLRQQYTQRNLRPNPPNGNSHSSKSTFAGVKKVCPHYQTGTCAMDSDHKTGNIHYRHICAYCFNTISKPFPHREQECRRKKGQMSQSTGPAAGGQ